MKIFENSVIKGNASATLAVFDLDMTLVITSAKINAVDSKNGKLIKSLTPEEFNNYSEDSTHVLDFTDFANPEILRKGKLIHKIFRQLRKFYKLGIPVAILTARSNSDMIRKFFLQQGLDIHKELVIAVNDRQYKYTGRIEDKKQQALLELIDKGFKFLIFYDDHEDNLKKAKEIEKIRPEVKVSVYKV